MQLINKVAFMVHEPNMFAHYSSVWAEMDRDSFVIVLTGVFSNSEKGEHGTGEFLNKVNSLGYEVTYLSDIVARNIKYEYVVSNHILGGRSPYPESHYQLAMRNIRNAVKKSINLFNRYSGRDKRYQISNLDSVQYPPLQAGIKQIRFMYGADISDAWSLDAWNEIYDLFLCHGPNDEMHLKKRFEGKTAVMGYPRYDRYFSADLKVDDVIAEFGIDPAKSTILWMPTYDAFKEQVCSIPYFANEISQLKHNFNIIVRPHPISFRVDREGIELLESLGFNIDRDPTRDMNKLFRVAETVLCDQGGSAFGALYLGKKLVFLKTPAVDTATVVKESSNLDLMKYFPVLEVGQVETLGALINDTDYWVNCLAFGRELSDKYFANYRGSSSRVIAKILTKLDTTLS
jgi:hypothetical protein